jgi:hypothetical protein
MELEQNWTNSFEEDISQKLNQAHAEFLTFQKTQQIIYLQQAGNKLFSAIENFLMCKYKTKVKSYKELQQLVFKNKTELRLLRNAAQLHYFFYNGELQMNRLDATETFKETYAEFVKLQKK